MRCVACTGWLSVVRKSFLHSAIRNFGLGEGGVWCLRTTAQFPTQARGPGHAFAFSRRRIQRLCLLIRGKPRAFRYWISESGGYASDRARRSLALSGMKDTGKAKPFRISGGRAYLAFLGRTTFQTETVPFWSPLVQRARNARRHQSIVFQERDVRVQCRAVTQLRHATE